jgi:serine/threonine-protein kinase
VLDALEAAHNRGVVHRDLKPGNIFLVAPVGKDESAGDQIKVLDFGLAFLREESGAGRITRQGQTAGTPAYMAPEQCRGEEVDGRSDIYAFGCTLYEMLTGAPPFGYGEENGMETMAAHLYRPPQRPSVVRWDLGVPAPLEEALMRSLAKLPRDRFQSAAEMRAALLESLAEKPADEARGAGKKLGRPEASAATGAVQAADRPLGISGAGAHAQALFAALGAAGMRATEVAADADLRQLAVLLVAPPEGKSALDDAAKFAAQAGAPPVLLCGAEDDLQQMAKAIGAGVFDYVPLPLDAADLSRKVARALRRRR